MAGEIPQGGAHQQENSHRSSDVERCVSGGQLEHATGYQRERDSLGQNPEGRSQKKVAVSNGRQPQQKIDDQPADGELTHGKDQQRRRMPVKMLLKSPDARPVAQDEILAAAAHKQKQGIITGQCRHLRPQQAVPESKRKAADGTEQQTRYARGH